MNVFQNSFRGYLVNFTIWIDLLPKHEVKLMGMVTSAMKLKDSFYGRKAMTNLDSILKKQRRYFADKSLSSQSYGFSSSYVWMWDLDHKEGWAPKIDAFELVLEKTLNIPWIARRNQSILKEINLEYSLEGLILKLQYFGHLMWRADSFEKTLMLGKIEGTRRRGWQRIR